VVGDFGRGVGKGNKNFWCEGPPKEEKKKGFFFGGGGEFHTYNLTLQGT